jgi:preprotein translocase subunit SecA
VDYDNVVNKHREVIYGERDKILMGADLKANILDMVGKQVEQIVQEHCIGDDAPDLSGVLKKMAEILPLPENIKEMQLEKLARRQLVGRLIDYARQVYDIREQDQGMEQMRILERLVMLRMIDEHWMEHLAVMERLLQNVRIESVQKMDPLVVFKRQSGVYFDGLIAGIQHDIVHIIYKVNIEKQ